MMSEISFHEATVAAFWKEGNYVRIELSDVSQGPEKIGAIIEISNVIDVITDGCSVDELSMVYADGEVLTLECTPPVVRIIIQWNDFRGHTSVIRSYRIEGRDVTLRLSGVSGAVSDEQL